MENCSEESDTAFWIITVCFKQLQFVLNNSIHPLNLVLKYSFSEKQTSLCCHLKNSMNFEGVKKFKVLGTATFLLT